MVERLDRCTAPSIQKVQKVNFPRPIIGHLDNGIEVAMFNLGSQEVVQVELIFEVPRSLAANPLTAKAANTLVGEATRSKKAGVLGEEIDYLGSFLESSYSVDHSSISLFCLNKKLGKSLELFKEAVIETIFEDRELGIYLSNEKQKYLVSQEKVSTLSRRLYAEKLYGDHYYGHRTEIEDFDNVNFKDLEQFYKNYYTANNCKIIVAGKVEQGILEKLNSCFGALKDGPTVPMEKSLFESNYGKFHFEKSDAIQSGIRVGKIVDCEFGSEDYFSLKVANTVLGGYFGSRLMSNIREDKGYTYGIGSSVSKMKNATVFSIATEVGKDVTEPALDEMYKELNILNTELISEQELEVVQNYMLGSILKSSDGPFSMAQQYKGIQFLGEDLSYFQRFIEGINNVTPEKILESCKKYLASESMIEAVAGAK